VALAHEVVELEAAEAVGMRRDHLPEDPRQRIAALHLYR